MLVAGEGRGLTAYMQDIPQLPEGLIRVLSLYVQKGQSSEEEQCMSCALHLITLYGQQIIY